jgi:hypothetical protein
MQEFDVEYAPRVWFQQTPWWNVLLIVEEINTP